MSPKGENEYVRNMSGMLEQTQRQTGTQVEIHPVQGTGPMRRMWAVEARDRQISVYTAVVFDEDDP